MSLPRVALVKHPEQSEFAFGAYSLGVLAASIRDVAHVSLIDATDMSIDEAIRQVQQAEPGLIGTTVMGGSSIPQASVFVERLVAQTASRPVPIVVGGHGASMLPRAFLEAGAAVVVVGEGETSLRQIVQTGAQPGAPGTVCKNGDSLVWGPPQQLIKDLDALRPPARDLMPPPRDGIHLMETSRGCPHDCSFCETTRFFGRRWRCFSAERVHAEVARLVEEHGAWTILIADDNFAAQPSRVIEIGECLSTGPLPALLVVSARADDLLRDPKVIPSMAAARMLRVCVGVETLEPEAAARARKPIDAAVYQEVFAQLRAHGIFSVASFIVGLPGQVLDEEETVEQVVATGPDSVVFNPFVPMPNTPLAALDQTAEKKPAFMPQTHHEISAKQMTARFYQHPKTRQRLERTSGEPEVRGILARAVLKQHTT
ncbi:MAG: radical SAM protein [Myxococcota bacterium]|nr:radical SAM protein [Myxococcota bacterium]